MKKIAILLSVSLLAMSCHSQQAPRTETDESTAVTETVRQVEADTPKHTAASAFEISLPYMADAVTVKVEVNKMTGWRWFQIWVGRILGILFLAVIFVRSRRILSNH